MTERKNIQLTKLMTIEEVTEESNKDPLEDYLLPRKINILTIFYR